MAFCCWTNLLLHQQPKVPFSVRETPRRYTGGEYSVQSHPTLVFAWGFIFWDHSPWLELSMKLHGLPRTRTPHYEGSESSPERRAPQVSSPCNPGATTTAPRTPCSGPRAVHRFTGRDDLLGDRRRRNPAAHRREGRGAERP